MLFAFGLSLALSIPGGTANLHPDFATKVDQLVTRSAQAGVRLKIISGYRKLDVNRARTQRRASWHNFGLAIDLNLVKRRDMKDALAHWGEDAKDWQTVARIGREVGLIWGGEWQREEIFHFEWHPGQPSSLKDAVLTALLAEAGPDGKGFKRTWHRFGQGAPAPAVVVRPDARRPKRPGPAAKARKTVDRPKPRREKVARRVVRRKQG